MLIRPACHDDLPSITAIYGRSVEEEIASFELAKPSIEEMGNRMKSLKKQGYPYLVADLFGEIAGYCYANAYRPRPAYAKTVECTVYVAPDHWRKGLATALLGELVNQCRTRSFRQMIAVIACKPDVKDETTGSIALHEKAGFKVCGRLAGVGFKHGQWLDVVLMQRGL